jgi:hypothetical protein
VTRSRLRILGVADSDSYVKWGAATLARAPRAWEASFVVLDTPFVPTAAQRAAAVDGLIRSDSHRADPPVLSLAELTELVAREQPDVVFLSLRGPMIRVVLRAVLEVSGRRPILVSGLPGISIPATRKALTFRSQVDLILLHSKRELRDFPEVAEKLRIEQEFGLATLPFFATQPRGDVARDEIVFAAQAKVPRLLREREAIVGWLAECARAHPELRVVIKLRAVAGEKQTHAEQYPYDRLLAEFPSAPENLLAESGSMAAHLERAVGLVTVSSTALLEAAAIGVPGLALADFGVTQGLINTVFEGSNLVGPSEDLVAGRFRMPDPQWLDDNYFHDSSDDDWVQKIEALVAARDVAPLPLRRLRYGQAGGRLRHVWDRKRALGSLDRSFVGYVALAIGYPARALTMTARRGRGLYRAVRRSVSALPIELPPS